MDFNQLHYFVTLAKYKQFTVAAEELHLSQSSLSKQIKALEEKMDTKLFIRTAKGCELTEEGEVFKEFALNTNESHQGILQKMNEFSSTKNKLIHLGSMPIMWEYKISKAMAHFIMKDPSYNFNIMESSNTFDLIKRMKNGEFNLIIVGESLLDPQEFKEVPLMKDHLMLIVSEDNKLSNCNQISLSKILHEKFILLDKCTGLLDFILDVKGFGFPNSMTGYTNSSSVLSLVRDNVGVTLLWKNLLNGVDLTGLKTIELEEDMSCHVVMGIAKHRKLSNAEKEFIEFIQEWFNVSALKYR